MGLHKPLHQGLEELDTKMEAVAAATDKAKTAAVNAEARYMLQHLSGAECSRLLACRLHEHRPHGPVATWRSAHAQRVVEELKAKWTAACHCRNVRPSEHLWRMITEGGYMRAAEEHAPAETNEYGESIRLQDKIAFWRANIPAAVGQPGQPNLVEEMRQVQLQWYAADGVLPPAVLFTDLCGWRQYDLEAWAAAHPGRSMSQP